MSVGKKLAAHNGYATPRACVQFHEDAADAPNVLQRAGTPFGLIPQIAEKPVDNPMECVEEELLVYKVLETYCVAISALL